MGTELMTSRIAGSRLERALQCARRHRSSVRISLEARGTHKLIRAGATAQGKELELREKARIQSAQRVGRRAETRFERMTRFGGGRKGKSSSKAKFLGPLSKRYLTEFWCSLAPLEPADAAVFSSLASSIDKCPPPPLNTLPFIWSCQVSMSIYLMFQKVHHPHIRCFGGAKIAMAKG